MRAVIRPGRARGEMAAPPSKSMAHRLLICAALRRVATASPSDTASSASE